MPTNNERHCNRQRPGKDMARRIENECAYCAEEINHEQGLIGKDWKVYCSQVCVEMGETMSDHEWRQLMSVAIPTRDSFVIKQIV
jgi:hypothetical protein